MQFVSPLRYPGGKAGLTGFIADTINKNDLYGSIYYEPYAGGAGAALNLLKCGTVSELFLNDADRRIYSFWKASLVDNDRFIDQINSISLDISEWYRQREICLHPEKYSLFEVGFAVFFMNRCNRSGVITGAGPIGGYQQNGKWRMDARFNRKTLSERVLALKELKQQIHIFPYDAINFLKRMIPLGKKRRRVFVYLDPPYVTNGQRLYLNAYTKRDHICLSKYLASQNVLPWLMSYDDTDFIQTLYKKYQIATLPLNYSLQKKHAATELIIAPQHVTIPCTRRMNRDRHIVYATLNSRRAL